MATHDYIISNASGAAVRADLNNALAAIVSNNSSATEPATTYAYMWWADIGSSPPVLKIRNAANTNWITLFQLDGEFSTIALENGTAAAPSLYFKDSGTDTGLYSPGTDQVAITTAGAQRATVDSSGRLLVGTSTSRSAGNERIILSETTNNSAGITLVRNTNDTGGPAIGLAKSRGTTVGSNTIVQSGDLLGAIFFLGADGVDIDTSAAAIRGEVDGTPGANDMPGRLVFSTTADGASSPTERQRISSNGQNSQFFSSTYGCVIYSSQAAGTSVYNIWSGYGSSDAIGTGGTVSFRVSTNGNAQNTNNSYGAISDAKLKENIVDATSQWSDIKALQVRKYNFKEGQTHTQIGLVAQEVELVSPGLVSESPDIDLEGNDLGTVTKSVNYSVLYMKAVKALQEAMERIEILEASNTDLLARVSALESA